MKAPRLTAAFRSDPGRDPTKQRNEDAVAFEETPLGCLAIVCDGMGGHARGAEASEVAIRTVVEALRRMEAGAHPGVALKQAIEEAGRRVYELARPGDQARPGSTLVALLCHQGGTEVAHCGDSRAYVLRRGALLPLTRDHSLVRELLDSGKLRPEEASGHPDSNKITRALGLRMDCAVEVRPVAFVQETHDVFLLVSDGVTDVIDDADLLALAQGGLATGMDALAARAVHIANARGGPDNTTVLVAHVDDPGLLPDRVATRARHPVDSAAQGATQTGDTITDEGAPGTLRLPPAPLPVDRPADARGQTQVLATAPAPAEALAGASMPSPPAGVPSPPAGVPSSGEPAGKVPGIKGGTVKLPVHGGAVADARQAGVTETEARRGKRLYVGLALMSLGAVLSIVALLGLGEPDEAPPPLLESPRTPPGASK